jgi:hypothetical protein
MSFHRNAAPNFIAGGDIYPSRFVMASTAADNTALGCTAGFAPIGISQVGSKVPITNPQGQLGGSSSVSPDKAAESGDQIQIFGLGDICWLECGGTVTRGDLLEAAGTTTNIGRGITSNVYRNYGAEALESGTVGQLIRVQILLGGGSGGGVIGTITTGAITQKEGLLVITKGSAATDLTLAAPTAGSDDGKILRISGGGAYAHVITQTTPGFNNGSTASDVATFGTAVCQQLTLQAYNGIWYVIGSNGVTIA